MSVNSKESKQRPNHPPKDPQKSPQASADEIELCAHCEKTPELCICAEIKPAQSRLEVLILQHPQEPDKDLSSAPIITKAIENATRKVGLSWANLSKAAGYQVESPARWGVLFVKGSDREVFAKFPPSTRLLSFKKGRDPEDVTMLDSLEGIVILDGTWAQGKTLWWRNPWLLKLQRLSLRPAQRSLYGRLRKEPRRECVSSLEATAETLEILEKNQVISNSLRDYFKLFLDRYNAQTSSRLKKS